MSTSKLDFLKQLDFLGYQITLRYNKNDRFVSKVGGFLTVVAFTVIIALFGVYLEDLVLYRATTISTVLIDSELSK